MDRQFPYPSYNKPKHPLQIKLESILGKISFNNKYIHTFLIYGIFISIFILAFRLNNFSTSGPTPNVGDSFITDTIAAKELQSHNTKLVQSRSDLEEIAQDTELGFVFYRILPGENLSSIAYKFGLSMSTVLSLNSLDNAHSVSVGQRILLPTRSGILYNNTNKTTVQEIAELYGIDVNKIIEVNNLHTQDIKEGKTLFLPDVNLSYKAMASILGFQFVNPVPRYRRLSSRFGMRLHPILKRRILHTGIDLAAPTGTAIVASKEGRIISAGWKGGYGLTTVIRHNNGFTTLYAHQSKIHVKVGQWVNAGQHIGNVGNTGRSTGPHLHFEIRKYGQVKNPFSNGLQL